MSGVVNKSVADRAVAVQADELVRKPFQPQELIGRVRNLLTGGASVTPPPVTTPGTSSLDSLFAPPLAPPRVAPVVASAPPMPLGVPAAPFGEARPVEAVWPRAVAEAFHQQHVAPTPVLSA